LVEVEVKAEGEVTVIPSLLVAGSNEATTESFDQKRFKQQFKNLLSAAGNGFRGIKGPIYKGRVGGADSWDTTISLPGWQTGILIANDVPIGVVCLTEPLPDDEAALNRSRDVVRQVLLGLPEYKWKVDFDPAGNVLLRSEGKTLVVIARTRISAGHFTSIMFLPQ
jgi:hypothetical protein